MSKPASWERESVLLPRDLPPVVISAAALLIIAAAAAFMIGIFVVPVPRRGEASFEVIESRERGYLAEVLLVGVAAEQVPPKARVSLRFEDAPPRAEDEGVVTELRDKAGKTVLVVEVVNPTHALPGAAARPMRGTALVDLTPRPLVLLRGEHGP